MPEVCTTFRSILVFFEEWSKPVQHDDEVGLRAAACVAAGEAGSIVNAIYADVTAPPTSPCGCTINCVNLECSTPAS